MSNMMARLRCSRCDKALWKKNARLIDGKIMCSTCMFAPAQVGRSGNRQDRETGLGSQDEHAVGNADAPKGASHDD